MGSFSLPVSAAWDRSPGRAVREGPLTHSQLRVEATEASQAWRGHRVPGEPGPHPELRQGAHSGPPSPAPPATTGIHPAEGTHWEAEGGSCTITKGLIVSLPAAPPPARGLTPPPSLRLACLPLPRTWAAGSLWTLGAPPTPHNSLDYSEPHSTSPVWTRSPREPTVSVFPQVEKPPQAPSGHKQQDANLQIQVSSDFLIIIIILITT